MVGGGWWVGGSEESQPGKKETVGGVNVRYWAVL